MPHMQRIKGLPERGDETGPLFLATTAGSESKMPVEKFGGLDISYLDLFLYNIRDTNCVVPD